LTLPNHKGPLIRAFLRRNKRLTVERLPAYAPDLNPAEAVWSWLKYGQLANVVPDGVPELDDEVADRLIELKFDPGLLRLLWGRSDLPFPQSRSEQPCLPAGQYQSSFRIVPRPRFLVNSELPLLPNRSR